jgi:hypothetical protein
MGPRRWLAAEAALDHPANPRQTPSDSAVGDWSLLTHNAVRVHFQISTVEGALRRPLVAFMVGPMERPTRFEEHRWLGDKRNQVVHDLDACDSAEVIEELMAAETFICFGPDTLAEARNRGYRLCRTCDGVRAERN